MAALVLRPLSGPDLGPKIGIPFVSSASSNVVGPSSSPVVGQESAPIFFDRCSGPGVAFPARCFRKTTRPGPRGGGCPRRPRGHLTRRGQSETSTNHIPCGHGCPRELARDVRVVARWVRARRSRLFGGVLFGFVGRACADCPVGPPRLPSRLVFGIVFLGLLRAGLP